MGGGPQLSSSTKAGNSSRTGKDTGIGHFPSHAFALNQAWLAAALIAATLLAWLRLLTLDGPLAKASRTEPPPGAHSRT